MQKRSLTLAGHKTSLALEEEFWRALAQIARQNSTTIPRLISRIDTDRDGKNLSSAVRVFVLGQFQKAASKPAGFVEPLASPVVADAVVADAVVANPTDR